jgi:hypothetical protein
VLKEHVTHKTIFYLLLALLPLNLAKHFIGDYSYVNGILVDYLMPAVYVTDLLILALVALCISSPDSYQGEPPRFGKFIVFFLLLFTFFSLLSAQQTIPALYRFIKLAEGVFLFYYITRFVDLKKDLPKISTALSIAVIWASLLGILQFVIQKPVFGYLPFGEVQSQLYNPNIAKVTIFGKLMIRSYGPFPHPNIFAGFLAIALTVILNGFRQGNTRRVSADFTLRVAGIGRLALLLGIPALFLTFSRTGILAFLVALAVYVHPHLKGAFEIPAKKKSYFFLGATAAFIGFVVLLGNLGYLSNLRESLSHRIGLSFHAIELWRAKPFFGIGLNQYSYFAEAFRFQPVHNIFFLILSEAGIFTFTAALLIAFKATMSCIKIKRQCLLGVILVLQLLLFANFDHYFLTIQQGILLFWLTLGLIVAYTKYSGRLPTQTSVSL